jgi:hypothetical protein
MEDLFFICVLFFSCNVIKCKNTFLGAIPEAEKGNHREN